jgi:hypothetical protein
VRGVDSFELYTGTEPQIVEAVRAVFDPAWLLNPAKVFPLEGRLAVRDLPEAWRARMRRTRLSNPIRSRDWRNRSRNLPITGCSSQSRRR